MKVYEFALKMRDLASSKVEKLNKLAGGTKTKVEQLGAQARKTAGEFQQRFPVATRKVNALGVATTRTINKVSKLASGTKTKLQQLGTQVRKAAGAFQQRFPPATRQVNALGTAITKVTGKANKLFQSIKKGLATSKSLFTIGGVADPALDNAIKKSVTFNTQLSKTQSVAKSVGTEMGTIHHKATEMGKRIKVSTTDINKGFVEFAQTNSGAVKAVSGALKTTDVQLNQTKTKVEQLGTQADETASNLKKGFSLAGRAVNLVNRASKLASKSTQWLGNVASKVQNRFSNLRTKAVEAAGKIQNRFPLAGRAVNLVNRAAKLASKSVQWLGNIASKVQNRFTRLGEKAAQAASRVQSKFPVASRAVLLVAQATTRVIRKMGKLRGTVAAGVSKAFRGLKKTMLAVGAAATLTFGVAVKESMGFNAQMSRVQAISNASTEEFQVLRNKALEMGKSTKFSAKEAGQGLEYLGMAGFSAKDAASALGGVLNLAAASGMDLGRTADIASNAISAFGLSADQSDRVADVFAKTITSSNTNLEMLAESMKYLAPTARALGVSLEESASAIGILGDNGLQGSVATTTLASGFNRLAKPTRQMRKLMKGLGIEMFDAKGKFKGIAGMIQELGRVTVNMTDQQKQATIATLYGSEATKNMLSLLNGEKKLKIDAANATQVALMKRLIGEKRLQAALKKGGEITLKGAEAIKGYDIVLNTAAGTAKKMAKTMEDNLAGDVTKAKSAFSGLMIEIGDRFDPFLRRMTQSMTGVLSDLGENFGTYYKILSDAFAPLRKAFAQFKRDLFGAKGSLGDFGNASLGVKEVVQGIAQAVGFVSPFIATMLTNISGLIGRLATTFAPLKESITQLLGGLRTNLLMVSQDVWNIAGSLIGALSPLIEVVLNVSNAVMENFGHIWKTVTGVVNMVLPFVYQLADSFRANVDVSGLLGNVVGGVTAVINGLRPVLRVILRLLTPLAKLFLWIGGILVKVVGVAFEGLGTIVGKVFGGIGKLFNWLIDKFSWVFNKIKQGLRLIGVMSKEADKTSQKQKEKSQQDKKPKPKTPAEEQKEKEEKERKKRVKKLQDEIDKFNEDRKKKTVGTMSNTSFNQLITPTKKTKKPNAGAGASAGDGTTTTSGMNKITGGGSKQVNINITIGNIIGMSVDNINNLDAKGQEVQQSTDFIVQEIVRKINGAMMVQEG